MGRFERLRAAGAFAAVIAVAGTSSPARAAGEAEVPAPISVPTAELRLVAGLGFGAEAAGSLLDHRLRLDAGAHTFIRGRLGEAAALARVLGSPSNALWLRGGFMYHSIDTCSRTDEVTAWDAGVAYRKRFADGSLFTTETGVEYMSRGQPLSCNDSGLPGSSGGVRLVIAGQVALTRWLGIYARVGVRTGAHLNEIGFLPDAWAGLAFEI
jgi:hypothetical protein